MYWAEVAPAAPILIDALPALTILAACLVVVGLVYVLHAFVEALFGGIESLIGSIPFVGGQLASAVSSAERAISSALGRAESSLDTHIATQLHRLARIADHLWHVLEDAAQLIFALAVLGGAAVTLPILHAVERPILKTLHRLEHLIHVARVEAAHLVKRLEHSVAQGVYPRLRSLEHEVGRVIPRELKRTRALAKEAEAEAAKAWELVKSQPWVITRDAAIAIVATALAAMGLTGLRCNALSNALRNRGCGLWSGLEDLLGLLFDAVLVVDLCALLPELEALFAELEAPLVDVISSAANAVCAQPPGGWVELSAPALSLPAVYYTGTPPGT